MIQDSYIYRNFELRYPYLAESAVEAEELEMMQLLVTLDDGTRVLYDDIDGTCELLREVTEEVWRYRFGKRLFRKMSFAGLTRTELAEKSGISYISIVNYINGKRVPSVYQFEKLAQALGCTIDDLLNFPR